MKSAIELLEFMAAEGCPHHCAGPCGFDRLIQGMAVKLLEEDGVANPILLKLVQPPPVVVPPARPTTEGAWWPHDRPGGHTCDELGCGKLATHMTHQKLVDNAYHTQFWCEAHVSRAEDLIHNSCEYSVGCPNCGMSFGVN